MGVGCSEEYGKGWDAVIDGLMLDRVSAAHSVDLLVSQRLQVPQTAAASPSAQLPDPFPEYHHELEESSSAWRICAHQAGYPGVSSKTQMHRHPPLGEQNA